MKQQNLPEPVQEVLEETKPSRVKEKKEPQRKRPTRDEILDRQWS